MRVRCGQAKKAAKAARKGKEQKQTLALAVLRHWKQSTTMDFM